MKSLDRAPRRGATLIEFAFVIPVLLLIVMGILEFGWYARHQLAIANATREGARSASIGRPQAEIRTRIINAAAPVVVDSSNITLEYSTNSGGSYAPFPPDDTGRSPVQNGVPSGSLVRVSLSSPYRRLVGLPITPSRINIQVSMVRERS